MRHYILHIILLTMLLQACGSYKQNIMFRYPEGGLDIPDEASGTEQADQNYTLQPNDYLELDVYTKNGELLIDPELELVNTNISNAQNIKPRHQYLIQQDGLVKFPMIGSIKLAGLTLQEAEATLEQEYEAYYTGSFVKLQYVNKRVVVLGAMGGHVVPLPNENIRVTEVLALAEGIDNNAKVQNIRLLRGENVYQIDLSTVTGYRNTNMVVAPGDIIYIEPIKRAFSEFAKENGAIITVLSSVVSLIVVLISIK